MSSSDTHNKKSNSNNSLNNENISICTASNKTTNQKSSQCSLLNSDFKKTSIHLTENQVHDAAQHFHNNQLNQSLVDENTFLNKSQQCLQNKRNNTTSLKIDHTGWHRFLPRCLRFAFADHEFEQLYREYYENEKRTDFKTLILIIFIINLSFFTVRLSNFTSDKDKDNFAIILGSIAIFLFLSYILVSRRLIENQRKLSLRLSKKNQKDSLLNQLKSHQKFFFSFMNLFTYDNLIWLIMPYLIWFLILFEIYTDLIYFSTAKFSLCDALSSLLLFTYAIYVVFPLRLRIASSLAISMAIYYLTLQLYKQNLVSKNSIKLRLVFADLFLIICVNLIGLMSYFFYEKRQRRAFLETCNCLENKIAEEEESQEQERLLLSVLPKHVANNIREDLGSVVNKPFQRIYMKRHEEVSILFADIVGFTAISSTLAAPQLVRILNELFARFDKLSEKYHQLRIKILGDCYYCISGAPDKRPDHAVLCVHMGLSMVEVIKSVRDQTKFNIDMRVGIHTGGVIAGVLGQKQWQFDVYSKDVELANKMESSGLPGRVHISESTVNFLNGEFELSDGDGASREETIRQARIKTFFIVNVLKPYPQGTLDEKNQTEQNFDTIQLDKPNEQQKLLQETIPAQSNSNDTNNNLNNTERKISNAVARSSVTGQLTSTIVEQVYSNSSSCSNLNQQAQNMDEYHRRLRYELLNRDNVQMAQRIRPFTFNFSDQIYEHSYMNNSDDTAGVSLIGLPITALLISFAEFSLSSSGFLSYLILTSSWLAQSFLAILCTIPNWAGRRSSLINEMNYEKDNFDLEGFGRKNTDEILMQNMESDSNKLSPLKSTDHYSSSTKLDNVSFNKKRQDTSIRYSSTSRKSISNKYRLSDNQVLIPNYLPKSLLSISLAVQKNAIYRLLIYLLMIFIWLSTSTLINLDYLNLMQKTILLNSSESSSNLNFEILNNLIKSSLKKDKNEIKLNDLMIAEINKKQLNSLNLADSQIKNLILQLEEYHFPLFKSVYLTYYLVLLLLAISALKRISLLLKIIIISGCALIQSVLNFVLHKKIFEKLDLFWYNSDRKMDSHLIYLTIQILGVTVSCFILNRQFELMSRRLFLWQKEVEEQKKKVKVMKTKNEKLLYNILPPHVATHFLGRRKRDEELYSKSYNSVGVLFAAMPNFTDFYTEESVNKQGLECLRFLNEVISDFDFLLNEERFHNISKIKTISSTYMAASGLNSENDFNDEESDLAKRWSHLVDLTYFALALKETLNNINKESFNNFVLKIGINHGPITAGVIGARKPHYDIWGNTVNVASRMESTGKAGCIQVTEETSQILQLFGFNFEPRGLVSVKGKGKLKTFYLLDPK